VFKGVFGNLPALQREVRSAQIVARLDIDRRSHHKATRCLWRPHMLVRRLAQGTPVTEGPAAIELAPVGQLAVARLARVADKHTVVAGHHRHGADHRLGLGRIDSLDRRGVAQL
jgi:hypothetical protein